MTLGMIFNLIGGLGVFLFGMKIMSESLQRVAGTRLRGILTAITANRFIGVMTGFMLTALWQSSSATTVMVVSLVNAQLLSLTQAVGVIMGANIGTTVTGWLISLLGFKVKISAFALPAIGIGFFARFTKSDRITYWGEALLGFGLLFLGLSYLKSAIPGIRENPEVVEMIHRFHATGLLSTMAVVAVGTLITVLVQSSSASMALTLAAAAEGLIDFPTSAALVLGENIGTTITANLAAIGASTTAKQSARAHFLFNVLGVTWVLILLKPFVTMVNAVVPGDPTVAEDIPVHLAMFHTMFNCINTLVFLPFAGQLAKLAIKITPERVGVSQTHFVHIDSTILDIPSSAIYQAKAEVKRMLGIVLDMFTTVMEVVDSPDVPEGEKVEHVNKQEVIVDALEHDITAFLGQTATSEISTEESYDINMMLMMVGDIERIGDHCESLLKLSGRKYEKGMQFTPDAVEEIKDISEKVRSFIELLVNEITNPTAAGYVEAEVIEQRINALRTEMRKNHLARVNEGSCDALSGMVFVDMLTSFEKIGDHAFNVAEAIAHKR